MNEPYFEDQKLLPGEIAYPFHCHFQKWHLDHNMASAHWHDYIEILYIMQEAAAVFLNGQFYSISSGDMIVISSREVHAVWGEPDTSYILS